MHINQIGRQLYVITLTLLVAFLILLPVRVLADTYTVTASVPYAVPTITATISSPIPNFVSNTNSVTLQGTCQVLSPSAIVSVWNGLILVGSTTCIPTGNYSLNIPLNSGVNILTVRTSNISSAYGPDSTVFNVTYNKEQDVAVNQPAASSPAAKPIQRPQDQSEITLTSPDTFGILSSDNSVTITLTIKGGAKPYNIQINWGDGTTLSQDVNESGNYSFTHTYDAKGNYNVVGQVFDGLGESKIFSWAVVSEEPLDQFGAPLIPGQINPPRSNTRIYVYIGATIAVLAVGGFIFLSGQYFQASKMNKIPKKPSNKSKLLR